MKKSLSILPILGLICVHRIFAQSDTIFLNALGVIVSRSEATHFRTAMQDTGDCYVFREYLLNGKPAKVFHANNLRGNVLHGRFTEYDTLGRLVMQGYYEKGYKTKEWIYFFSGSPAKKERQLYLSPQEYYSFHYDSLTQFVESEGRIDKYGKRTGPWKYYHYRSDSVKTLYYFVTGKKEGEQYEFYPDGKLKRKEIFLNNKLQKGELFDENGRRLKYFPAFTYPQSKEYISAYLHRTEPCTADALKKKDFRVSLQISEEGRVMQADVMDVEQAGCAQKIRQALMNMKKWKPARREDKPVKYTLETTIKLYVPRD